MYGTTGAADIPTWFWLAVIVVCVVAEIIIRRLVKAGRIKPDSVWVRPHSRRNIGRYFLLRMGLLAVAIVVGLVAHLVHH